MAAKSVLQGVDSKCEPLANPPNASPRILVVEDEHDLRQLTAAVLIDSGYQVDVAKDGQAAWEALQRNNYALLITDHFLPKGSGGELLKKIHAAHMALPVITAMGFLPTCEFVLHSWPKRASLLFKPGSFDRFSGMVKDFLHPTACSGEASLREPQSQVPWQSHFAG